LSLPYVRATSSRIPESFLFQAQIALLPNDGVLPTASFFTESFEENLLPNGASLPNFGPQVSPFPVPIFGVNSADDNGQGRGGACGTWMTVR
jgi:hypothetical protein